MTRQSAVMAVLFILMALAALPACQPATPTPIVPTPTPAMIDAVYYNDASEGEKTTYAYIKCYGNGRATSVTISLDPPNTGTPLEVYNDIALHWLDYPPPNPAASGTYTLRGVEIELVLINVMDTSYLAGPYSPEGITVTGSDGVATEYLLLELP